MYQSIQPSSNRLGVIEFHVFLGRSYLLALVTEVFGVTLFPKRIIHFFGNFVILLIILH